MLLLAMACLLVGAGALRKVPMREAGAAPDRLQLGQGHDHPADDGEGAAHIGVGELMVEKIAGDPISEDAAQDDGTSQPDSLHHVRLLPGRLPSIPEPRQGAYVPGQIRVGKRPWTPDVGRLSGA